MGKGEQEDHNLPQQRHDHRHGASSLGLFCERCSSISRYITFRCFFVLLLSLALLVSGIFWILPSYTKISGFDAKDEIKLSATVQACFRLQKPVSQLVPYIERLEYDIYGEISTPDMKVVILSMHQSDTSNWTDVVFGVLSDPINDPINSVFLSVLRSSLIELFLQQSNLTLTTSIFGEPFMFDILKFPGGITIIPPQSNFMQSALTLFNFTLNNSISEMKENLNKLKDQLNRGLLLRPHENLFVQLTNEVGSTISSPVTVQAFVMSDNGIFFPQRLKQLAQTIRDSPADNLGLDNSVFGNVNSVILSSFLKGITQVPTPASSPAPTPELSHTGEPSTLPNPVPSPSYSPVSPPDSHRPPPCSNLRYSSTSYFTYPCLPCPSHSLPPLSSPAPSLGPSSQLSPDPSLSLAYQYLASPSSSAVVPTYQEIWSLGIYGFLIFHLICRLQ
ncbi:hypothetical protein HS088_TW08G00499 [Tripterygium wilfordii]|uniref:DUF7036 domain-containing protein n=1 Tax=Tripterygium wilfordii TaxID=458696 RepID=A0A7J7DC68_TRIWF|nr:uncharacterized protein LOC120003337 [Tripterygium wilfordii]KAF5743911.1 hypothetical protein HS088_TW08G00499 [Tripterygium wilfordii]